MAEQVSIRERVGIAVNSSDLAPTHGGSTIVAALGAAAMVRDGIRVGPAGPCIAVNAVGSPVIDARRRLASLLQRAKFGHDHSVIKPAIYLFVAFIKKRNDYLHWKIRNEDSLLVRFAGAVLGEWLRDRCQVCGGGGQILTSDAGRNASTKTCRHCKGNGAEPVSHAARAASVGVPMEIYQRHWEVRFKAARSWLEGIERSNLANLQTQIRRSTVRGR